MKKKILLAVTKSNFGGAQRYVFDIATNLAKDKYEVEVTCGGNGHLAQKLKEERIAVHSIDGLGRDMHPIKDISSFFAILKIIKKNRPNILHLNSPKAAALGALAGRILGVKKIIYTVHGFAFNEDRSALEKTLIKFFSWLTISLSHKVIFLSQKEMAQVSNWPFVKKKLEVIPLGIPYIEFESKEAARRKLSEYIKKNITNTDFLVGTIAELHKNKGLNFAIDALASLPGTNYIIIGDGEEKEFLSRQIEKRGTSHIHLAGRIENAASLLKAFDVFLLPSIKEGLPYVLLEAGSSGVPVIATTVGSIPELVSDGHSGFLVPTKDSEAIKEMVLYTSENKSLLRETGLELQCDVQKKHSLAVMIERLVMLYY